MRTIVCQAASRRRGTIVVFVAVCLVALLGILALTFDGGGLFEKRRHAQAAADAAALAAAADLYDYYWTQYGDDDDDTAKESALATAAANGFTNDGVDSVVTVNIPPSSGPYKDTRGYVEVIVQFNQSRSFSSIFSSGSIPVRARAVAIGSPVAADVGILVLDPTSRSSFNAQGSGTTDVKDTPIVVNSNHDQAAVAGGGGTVKADEFLIRGDYSTSGGGQFIGDIYTGRRGMEDPLIDLPVPNKDVMTQQSNNRVQFSNGARTLSPGVYRGGINVSGTGSLTLLPGIYYMDGGGFSFAGQGSLTGQGVMIYNDPGNGNSSGISVKGQGSLNISGPTDGVYKGITFFQNRTSTVTGHVEGAGGTTDIKGTFYFAGALLNVKGNGGVANMGSQYISWQLELGGNGDINIDWQPERVAPRRSIFLVE